MPRGGKKTKENKLSGERAGGVFSSSSALTQGVVSLGLTPAPCGPPADGYYYLTILCYSLLILYQMIHVIGI